MSLVGFHQVTLAQALDRTSTIVVAERAKADPARPIKPSDAPFLVKETLRGHVAKGALVYVAPAYTFYAESIAAQIEKQHGSYQNIPSRIEDAYKSSMTEAAFGKAKQVILFLGCDEAQLRCELSVVGGYESVKQRAAVEAAMKKSP